MTLRNKSTWSVVEFGATLLVQMLTMRLIVVDLGAGALGVWAVLMSAIQLARLLDPNAAAGCGRMLAIASERGDHRKVESILSAVFVSTFPLYSLLIALAYYPVWLLLPHIVQVTAVADARALLVYAAWSFLLQMVAAGYAASLVGLGCAVWKSWVVIAGILLQLLVSWLLIRTQGIRGFGIGQVVNYVFTIFACLAILRRHVGASWASLFGMRPGSFRELVAFGARMQITSLAWTGFEMAIRLLMARWGGLDQAGLFEAAYKVGSQTRILAAYVVQPVMPAIAVATNEHAKLAALYRQLFARLSLFGVTSSVLLVMVSPLVAWFMLGGQNSRFEFFLVLVAFASAAHIAAIPCELAAVGAGDVRYNMVSTLTVFAVMVLAGSSLGILFGGPGVAAAVAIASVSGATLAIVLNGGLLKLPRIPEWKCDVLR